MDNELQTWAIILPKLIGPLAGALVGWLATFGAKHGLNLSDGDQRQLADALVSLCMLLGYSLSSLFVTHKLNPANVASKHAIAPARPGSAVVVPTADAGASSGSGAAGGGAS